MENLIVVNKYSVVVRDGVEYVDIMRGSVLGNDERMMSKGDYERSRVIGVYRSWLWKEVKKRSGVYRELVRIIRVLESGGSVALVCCCAPKPCHGDVIVNCIRWMMKERRF
jgi:hypothetical protein